MALSSQGGLNFQQSRLQDSTESARGALTEFGSLAQRFQDNKLKAEALAEAKAQQALENKRADEMMAMRKSEFDTAQNTLRATSQGATVYDKAAIGNALLDKQASTLNKALDERIASLAAKNKMTVDQFNSSGGMQKAVEAGAFKDLTGVTGTGTEDTAPLSGGSIAKQADAMLGANAKNMQTQKQLIGEVGNQYFKEGQDGPMLYDPTSLNKYKQDLLNSLDTRIDREAAREQQERLERARLAQDAKQHNDRMRQQNSHMAKMEKMQQEEIDRGAAWQKSLIAPEKKTHKMYEAKFGTEVIIPANNAKAEYIKDVRSNLNKLPGMSMLRKDGMKVSVNEKTGAVQVLAIPGKKVDASDIADMQQSISDKISALTEKTRSKYESYVPMLRNPESFGYKLSSKKYYDSSIPNAVKVSGESYAPQRANFVEDPRAYAKEMQRQLLAGVDAYGNPLTPADIIIRRELLSNEQMRNAEIGASTSKSQDKIFSK